MPWQTAGRIFGVTLASKKHTGNFKVAARVNLKTETVD